MLEAFFDSYATHYSAYKQGDWCYEDGCIYRGLILLDTVLGWFGSQEARERALVENPQELFGFSPWR